MNEIQMELIRELLEHASVVGIQDTKDGAFGECSNGNNFNTELNEKEFDEVSNYIKNLIE